MSLTTRKDPRAGFALAAALGVLVLLSVLVVTVFANAMTAFRSGTMDVGKSRTYYAAEAGGESAMAQLADALEDAVLEDGELAMISAPTLTGFSFDSFDIQKIGSVEHERITDGPFTGLYSLTQMVEIYSQATDPDNNSSAVLITAKAQAIPIFQFGVFYDKDLEIHNGPPMYFEGWVHSNGNIYVSSDHTYFQDIITTPKKLIHDRKAYHQKKTGVYIDDASTNTVQLTFDSRSIPDANAFKARSNTDFDNRLKTDAYLVDSLRVPLPSGMDPIAVQQPRSFADGALEQQAKFAWKADWYIEVPFGSLSNPSQLCSRMIQVREPGKSLPSTSDCNNIFSLKYDAWYEGRQRKWVDLIEVDMAALFAWAGTNDARITQILYIFASGNAGQDPKGDGTYPVIRLKNATNLGNPFTFSTMHPVYTWGHYNAGPNWQPSALVGDAVTFLSSAWDDARQQGAFRYNSVSTNIYAAIMMGHSGSACDHEEAGCSSSSYQGGLENFPRFLERWSGKTLLYRGSLVSLHFAQQADRAWGGSYYSPPARDWKFDLRFEDPANLPPGTPVVGNVIHTAFRPIH